MGESPLLVWAKLDCSRGSSSGSGYSRGSAAGNWRRLQQPERQQLQHGHRLVPTRRRESHYQVQPEVATRRRTPQLRAACVHRPSWLRAPAQTAPWPPPQLQICPAHSRQTHGESRGDVLGEPAIGRVFVMAL